MAEKDGRRGKDGVGGGEDGGVEKCALCWNKKLEQLSPEAQMSSA